jgi:carbon-monoxide dehydrogenase medium subunit
MIPHQLDYAAPGTLEQVIALIHESKDARVLAGGQYLIADLKSGKIQPRLLVDLRRLTHLRHVEKKNGESQFRIGALATLSELAAHPMVRANLGAFMEAAGVTRDAQHRNAATLGGCIASGDPASDIAPALVVLEASIHVRGPYRERSIRAGEMFTGPFDTSLEAAEVITHITFPVPEARSGSAYERVKNPANGGPLAGVAARVALNVQGVVEHCSVCLTGVAGCPVRLREVEMALAKETPSPEQIARAAQYATQELKPVGNLAASAEYRAHLATVLTERVLARAARIAQDRSRAVSS